MPNEFLSQDEVDALLKGVSGDDDVPAAAEAPPGAVRPCNLATQERIVRGRMPALETLNDRFARLLRIGLFNFMRRSPEITVSPVRVMKYGDFVRTLSTPANFNLLTAKPLRGNALLVLDAALVSLVVDTLFGGDGRFPASAEGREFTATEQRIIQRVLGVMLADYQASWSTVHPLQFEFVRAETQPQFVNVAAPTEVVVVSTFQVEVGPAGGAFHVCMPYAMIEPIRDVVQGTGSGEPMEPDLRWVRMLSRQVQAAEVDLVAQLGTSTLRMKDLMNLKPGDILPVDISDTIVAAVDGVPVMECKYGVLNGQYALRIERMLAADADANANAGAAHA